MPRALSWIIVAAAAVAAGAGARAQAPVQPAAQAPASGFATSTTAVVVDVVVRDAKGAPIVDLKPSDFELLEDEVKQKIASVELIAPGHASVPAGAAARARDTAPPTSPTIAPEAPAAVAAGPTVIALVFHRLSPEARDLAAAAARGYLNRATADDYAGVFSIDTSLEVLQTFTTDRARLTTAIERAATLQAALHVRAPGMGSSFGDADGDVAPTASADSPGLPIGNRTVQSGPNSAASIDARFIKMSSLHRPATMPSAWPITGQLLGIGVTVVMPRLRTAHQGLDLSGGLPRESSCMADVLRGN